MDQVEAWADYWRSGVVNSLVQAAGATSPGVATKQDPLAEFLGQYLLSQLEGWEHVLDVATGNGALIRSVPEHLAARRVGIDYADIPVANDKRQKLEFIGGMDAGALDFANDSFDFIISQFGLEYAEREASLNEVLRVAKPCCRVVLICHSAQSLLTKQSRLQLAEIERVQGVHFFEQALNLLSANFETTALEQWQEQCALLRQAQRLPGPLSIFPHLFAVCNEALFGVGPVSRARARESVLFAQQALEANELRLQLQLNAAFDGQDRKQLVAVFQSAGFKAKTRALKVGSQLLGHGFCFTRAA